LGAVPQSARVALLSARPRESANRALVRAFIAIFRAIERSRLHAGGELPRRRASPRLGHATARQTRPSATSCARREARGAKTSPRARWIASRLGSVAARGRRSRDRSSWACRRICKRCGSKQRCGDARLFEEPCVVHSIPWALITCFTLASSAWSLDQPPNAHSRGVLMVIRHVELRHSLRRRGSVEQESPEKRRYPATSLEVRRVPAGLRLSRGAKIAPRVPTIHGCASGAGQQAAPLFRTLLRRRSAPRPSNCRICFVPRGAHR